MAEQNIFHLLDGVVLHVIAGREAVGNLVKIRFSSSSTDTNRPMMTEMRSEEVTS